MPSTVKGFAAAYTLLVLVVIGSGLGAYAAYTSHSLTTKVAHVQAAVGDQNLTRLADQAITQAAQAQGFGVVKIVVKSTRVVGDKATVVADVTVTDGVSDQSLELVVSFRKSTWQVAGMVGK